MADGEENYQLKGANYAKKIAMQGGPRDEELGINVRYQAEIDLANAYRVVQVGDAHAANLGHPVVERRGAKVRKLQLFLLRDGATGCPKFAAWASPTWTTR
jgi:hypothetical protein